MHISKKRKLIVLSGLAVLFVAFIMIVYSVYIDIRSDSQPSASSRTINILTWKHIPSAVLNGFQDKHPNYTINVERYSTSNYLSFLKTKLKTDHSVDIIEIPMECYGEIAAEGNLLPITGEQFLYRFSDRSLDYTRQLGGSEAVYGIPYHSDYLYLWYNKAIFAKYGLPVPDNMKDILKACSILTANDIPPLAMGLSNPDIAQAFLGVMMADRFSSDRSFTDPDPAVFARARPDEMALAADEAARLLEQNYLSAAQLTMTEGQAFQGFLDNHYAMAFTNESAVSMISESQLKKIDIDVTGIYITAKDGQKAPVGSPVDSLLAVCRNSDNRDICVEFLDYYSQYDTVTAYMEETKRPTNVQDYTINTELTAALNSVKESEPYVYREHFYFSPYAEETRYRTLSQKLLFHIITPEQYLKTIQKGAANETDQK